MNKEKIAVIIINYRTSHLIQKLVDSIEESEVDVSILILDNASTDSTYNELKAIKDERITLLPSKENLGFTGGINFALNYLMTHDPGVRYFFLLNPDAFSTANLISDMFRILKSDGQVAGVSPRILQLNGEPWYTGGMIRYEKGTVINKSPEEGALTETYQVDVFSGCAVLFDLQKVLQAGMFNEDLFMYFDEADLAIKLKERGYKILYSPRHTIYHDVSYSTRKISHLKTYYMARNKFMVFNKHMSLYNKAYFILHEFAYYLKIRRAKNAYYHVKGIYDFIKGKKGPLFH